MRRKFGWIIQHLLSDLRLRCKSINVKSVDVLVTMTESLLEKHPAMKPLFGGVEAGGTKFICALGDSSGCVLDEVRIETREPIMTFADIERFFKENAQGTIKALGIGSFGPLDLDPASPYYGSLTTTPKTQWCGINMVQKLNTMLGVPVSIDTDVNCAALGEAVAGNAVGLDSFCYITVGTGIGVGIFVNGRPLAGTNHAEVGHIRIPRHPLDSQFAGTCPFHGDCIEGLACGPSIKARWSEEPAGMPEEHPAWEIEADYVASLCVNLTYTVRPQRIILGGGVFQNDWLYGRVRDALQQKLASYALSPVERKLEKYIMPPGASEHPPGLIGAMELARKAIASAD